MWMPCIIVSEVILRIGEHECRIGQFDGQTWIWKLRLRTTDWQCRADDGECCERFREFHDDSPWRGEGSSVSLEEVWRRRQCAVVRKVCAFVQIGVVFGGCAG
jgi:hypothetical protein